MKEFAGKVAVITGAGSGFGREFARIGAGLGMKLVLADVQQDALDAVVGELRAAGAEVIGRRVDVSRGEEVQSLADNAYQRFGATHLLFNNAGVATGGHAWEHSEAEWNWVLGVDLWGVIHGLRCFVPRMLEQKSECHIVNTASVAGLISTPMSVAYNVAKHGVVTASETLYHELRQIGAPIGVTVLCPAYVATGIGASERNRPDPVNEDELSPSQRAMRANLAKAIASGRLSARQIAEMTFDAVREDRFYLLTHPRILDSVKLRMQDIVEGRNPSDPFTFKQDAKPRL